MVVGLNWRSSEPPENAKSPEKEERYYLTRGSSVGEERENGKAFMAEGNGYAMAAQERGSSLWPKLFISLSSKEKEEDFLAMKGCKLPQRPKKRAKLIQRTLLVSSSTSNIMFTFWTLNLFFNLMISEIWWWMVMWFLRIRSGELGNRHIDEIQSSIPPLRWYYRDLLWMSMVLDANPKNML